MQPAILLYRPLVWIGQDMAQDPARSLAASITAQDGNSRFTITLKPWRWSDGTPITADDVLFGWERILALGGDYPLIGQGGIPDRIATVRVTGLLQIDFTLKQPANPDWFILNGLSLVYPLPRHAWGTPNADTMRRRQADPSLYSVVDGPFRLTDFQPDRYAAYAPNPLYGGPPTSLARLVVAFPSGGSALHALQAGELDMARVPYALWQRLSHEPGFTLRVLPEPYGYWSLQLNEHAGSAPFLSDPAVRRALTAATDQARIIRLVYHGLGTENRVPLPTAAATWRTPGADPAIGFDPARARAELEGAGYKLGPAGLRSRGSHPLAFTVLTGGDPEGPELQTLQILQSDLRAIGVQLDIRPRTFNQIITTMLDPAGSWEAASVPISLPPVPDGTSYFNTKGSQNFSGYADPHMDALIAASVQQSGAAARDALHAYQAYAATQQPVNILPQGQLPLLVANRVHGVEALSNAAGYWGPEFLSVDDPSCPRLAAGGGVVGHTLP